MLCNHLILCRPLLLPPSIFPSIRVFPVSLLFSSGVQSIGASASASVLPVNIQGWFPLVLTSLISLKSKGLSRDFSSTTIWKHQFFGAQPSLWSNAHLYVTVGKTRQTFVGKVMCLLLNMLSKFVITFIPRSKHLLISWWQSLSTAILEPKERKSVTVSIFSPSICHKVMRSDAMFLVFWVLSFKPAFHSALSPLSRGSLVLCGSVAARAF